MSKKVLLMSSVLALACLVGCNTPSSSSTSSSSSSSSSSESSVNQNVITTGDLTDTEFFTLARSVITKVTQAKTMDYGIHYIAQNNLLYPTFLVYFGATELEMSQSIKMNADYSAIVDYYRYAEDAYNVGEGEEPLSKVTHEVTQYQLNGTNLNMLTRYYNADKTVKSQDKQTQVVTGGSDLFRISVNENLLTEFQAAYLTSADYSEVDDTYTSVVEGNKTTLTWAKDTYYSSGETASAKTELVFEGENPISVKYSIEDYNFQSSLGLKIPYFSQSIGYEFGYEYAAPEIADPWNAEDFPDFVPTFEEIDFEEGETTEEVAKSYLEGVKNYDFNTITKAEGTSYVDLGYNGDFYFVSQRSVADQYVATKYDDDVVIKEGTIYDLDNNETVLSTYVETTTVADGNISIVFDTNVERDIYGRSDSTQEGAYNPATMARYLRVDQGAANFFSYLVEEDGSLTEYFSYFSYELQNEAGQTETVAGFSGYLYSSSTAGSGQAFQIHVHLNEDKTLITAVDIEIWFMEDYEATQKTTESVVYSYESNGNYTVAA